MNRLSRVALLVFGLTAVTAAVAAEGTLPASKLEARKEFMAVIESQLAAFRKADVAKAFSYASAELQAAKPLRVFATIVKTNYPEIWANTRAEFGLARDDGEHATILVHVFSKEGDASYDFTLHKERAGWRIDGVLRHEPAKADKV